MVTTTQLTVPNDGVARWYMWWLSGAGKRVSSPRIYLKEQLLYLRRSHGRQFARTFVLKVRSIGEYPTKQ